MRDLRSRIGVARDDDHVVHLCAETVMEGRSILIFCPTKLWCEKLAETIAREFFRMNADDVNCVEGTAVTDPVAFLLPHN